MVLKLRMEQPMILQEKTLIMTESQTDMTMTLGIATILSQPMMSRIIFIIKQKIQKIYQKAKRFKRKITREKIIPISSIPEKRTMKPKRKRQTIKKAEKKLSLIEKRKIGFLKNRKQFLRIRLLKYLLYQAWQKEVKP